MDSVGKGRSFRVAGPLGYVWGRVVAKARTPGFLRNVVTVMLGSVTGQGIGFLLSPVISRLYAPSDFGIFGSFSAVVAVVTAGVTLDYPQALMLPKEEQEARHLLVASFASSTVVSLGCVCACLLAPGALKGLFECPSGWLLLLFVVAVFSSGVNRTLQAWCVRLKAFRHTSASQVSRSLSTNGVQIGLGYAGGGPIALAFGFVLGDMLASLNLGWVATRNLKDGMKDVHWRRTLQSALKYRDFPFYSASRNVINTLSRSLPILLLTHFYGIAVGGAYAFALRIVSAPTSLLLQALRQVLFQKACEIQNNGGRLMPIYVRCTLGLFGLALVPSMAVVVWAPQLFAWAFGPRWNMAGELARWLVVWILFAFATDHCDMFARILRIQGKMFILEQVMLVARATVLVVGGSYWTATQTVLWFAVVGALMNVLFSVVVGRTLLNVDR